MENVLNFAPETVKEFYHEFRPYVNILSMRAEALRKQDADLWLFACSNEVDRDKHRFHEQAVRATKKLEELYGSLGFDTNDRQAVGKFACRFVGEAALQEFAD